VWIVAVGAVGDVEPACRVADRAGEAADGDSERSHLEVRAAWNAPVRGLEPHEAAEPGRDADGSASVAARRQGDEATGDSGCGSTRRAARGPAVLPWIVRRAVEDRAGEVDAAEFAGGRETERDGAAGVAQALDVGEREAGDSRP